LPRVRLRIRQVELREDLRLKYTEPRRPGEEFEFPLLRLVTTVKVGNELQFRAVVDTGAWVSLIEYDTWTRLSRLGLVEFLPPPAGAATSRAVIAGHRSEFRLGRVRLGLIDRDEPNGPRELPPVPVVAQMLLDPQLRLPFPVVLGLHGGVLDGRSLRREPTLGFTPTGDPTADRADAGPRYGQQWYLDDA
jgi:hypothetical protein